MKLAALVALVASILSLALATIAFERTSSMAVAPAAPGSATSRPLGNPPPPELASAPAVAYISLELDAKNTCVPTFKSPHIYTGNGGVILWAVNNVNCKAVDVELLFDPNAANDPTEPKGRQKKIKLPAGDTRILSVRVRTGLIVGTAFTYQFTVNGTVYDPDIIIEF